MRGMKVKDADILFVPGYTNSGPDHWQTRWQSKLSTARRVEQAEWSKPVRDDWTAKVAEAVNEAERPFTQAAKIRTRCSPAVDILEWLRACRMVATCAA